MREILFRGKDFAGNWHYGVPLVFTEECVFITDKHAFNKAVIPKTVCQYTGVTDVNGSKIFEGDVVEVYCATGELRSSGSVVHWDDFFSGWGAGKYSLYGRSTVMSFKVVGNVYDNPELVEGGAKMDGTPKERGGEK